MIDLPVEYNILKGVTITLTALSIPLGTYVGFCFGQGRFRRAIVGLLAEVGLYVIDALVWWRMIEILGWN